jgi:hypothetical protein
VDKWRHQRMLYGIIGAVAGLGCCSIMLSLAEWERVPDAVADIPESAVYSLSGPFLWMLSAHARPGLPGHDVATVTLLCWALAGMSLGLFLYARRGRRAVPTKSVLWGIFLVLALCAWLALGSFWYRDHFGYRTDLRSLSQMMLESSFYLPSDARLIRSGELHLPNLSMPYARYVYAKVQIDPSEASALVAALPKAYRKSTTDRMRMGTDMWAPPGRWWDCGSARKFIAVSIPGEEMEGGTALIDLDDPERTIVYIRYCRY